MSTAKVAISIDEGLLTEIDRRVSAGEYATRSQAIQAAVLHLLDRERETASAARALEAGRRRGAGPRR